MNWKRIERELKDNRKRIERENLKIIKTELRDNWERKRIERELKRGIDT